MATGIITRVPTAVMNCTSVVGESNINLSRVGQATLSEKKLKPSWARSRASSAVTQEPRANGEDDPVIAKGYALGASPVRLTPDMEHSQEILDAIFPRGGG